MNEQTKDAPWRFIYTNEQFSEGTFKTYRLGGPGKELIEKIPTLATEDRVNYVFGRILEVEKFLQAQFLPLAKDAVLNYLSNHPDIDTKHFNGYLSEGDEWMLRSLKWDAKAKLEQEHLIESVKHGAGHQRTWRIVVEKVPTVEQKQTEKSQ